MSTRERIAKTQTKPAARAPMLQRKCACGGGASGLAGKCEECDRKALTLQRREEARATPGAVPPMVYDVLRSSGQPLDSGTRAFMESRFGHSFGHVRVHADAHAAESARAVNASAYTVGRDVVFGAGQYAPGTSQGRHLLAHELAHTIQQGSAPPSAGSLQVTDAGGPLEQEAEHAAGAVGEGRVAVPHAAPPAVARQPEGAAKGETKEAAPYVKADTCSDTPPAGVTLKPLTPEQEGKVLVAEHIRKLILAVAAGALLSLIGRIMSQDPELQKEEKAKKVDKPKTLPAAKGAVKPVAAGKEAPVGKEAAAASSEGEKTDDSFKPNDAHTIKTIEYFFDLHATRKELFNWPNTEKSKEILGALFDVTQLFLQNAKMQVGHRARSYCEKDTFACATSPAMTLCPVFFGKLGEAYTDPLYPARVITHEYFHYLKIPGRREWIYHGESESLQAPTYKKVIANAHALTNFALRLSLGRDVD